MNEGDSCQHNPHAIYAEMVVGGKAVKFQLDSGVACNLLPLSALPQGTSLQTSGKVLKKLQRSNTCYTGHSWGNRDQPCGTATPLRTLWSAEGTSHASARCQGCTRPWPVDRKQQQLQAHSFCVGTAHIPSAKHAIVENYATVSTDTVGTLPDPVHLRKDPGIQPVIMPARKLPLSMEEPVKVELTNLVAAGVLEPVDN